LIPLRTENKEHKLLVKEIISTFVQKIISEERRDKIDYKVKHDFLEKLAYYLLTSPKDEIHDYVKPLLDNFTRSEVFAKFFEEVISAEDRLNMHEIVWEIWSLFKEKVIGACKVGEGYWSVDRLIRSYLFAQTPWKESAKEWHTFKEENKRFFKDISKEIGHCPSTLYAISKLLNEIGSSYAEDGIFWISEMIRNNPNLWGAKLEINTIYYLENLVKKYTYEHREKMRKNTELKQCILTILDFLIRKGSAVGYLLRENVL
jgi:hypothetical protein